MPPGQSSGYPPRRDPRRDPQGDGPGAHPRRPDMQRGYPPQPSPRWGPPPAPGREQTGGYAPGPYGGRPQPPRAPHPRPVPGGHHGAGAMRQPSRQPHGSPPGSSTPAARTDPSLYQWDRLTTEQQQAVLRTIGMRQRSGMGRSLLIILTIVVSVALLAWAAYVALFVFHLGSHIGITL